ncbi:MAG: hypothetical protein Nkreftii_002706 [Candidatus Nitrospira kreftii]|uniref:Uncharacterized protein n=1 Tax=Candidatus Nitrospira kreftii TaxID=2652173 RepID=A0A7S8FFH9_9BACT|nr:MAG: hypothetical protein Nkreftii_002706 [Candidatus Nitrospira kreftii]
MTPRSIKELRGWIAEMHNRLGNIKFSEMVSLAESVGRTKRPGSSPPMYVSPLKGRRALPIHFHPGCMKKGTARASLNIIEGDIDAWELQIEEDTR